MGASPLSCHSESPVACGKKLKTARLVRILLVILFVAGCSTSDTHGTIEGSVTLDGRPLAEGVVRFVPANGDSQTASAAILNGKYTANVPLGKNRIEFSAPKVIGKRKMYETADSPEVDVVTELLPERYNVQSELQMDVQPGTTQHKNELVSD